MSSVSQGVDIERIYVVSKTLGEFLFHSVGRMLKYVNAIEGYRLYEMWQGITNNSRVNRTFQDSLLAPSFKGFDHFKMGPTAVHGTSVTKYQ